MIYLSMHRRPAYIEVQTDAGLINVHLRLGSLVGPTDKAGPAAAWRRYACADDGVTIA